MLYFSYTLYCSSTVRRDFCQIKVHQVQSQPAKFQCTNKYLLVEQGVFLCPAVCLKYWAIIAKSSTATNMLLQNGTLYTALLYYIRKCLST